jgi:hypothetical protein
LKKVSRNSYAGQLCLAIYAKLFIDLERKFPTRVRSIRRDYETVKSRYASEGISFFTKTLPKLGKALMKSFESNKLERPREFKSYGTQQIPAFMSGIISLCYDSSGTLSIGSDAPGLFRECFQIFFLAYKANLPYNESTIQEVLDRFKGNEQELSELVISEEDPILHRAADLLAELFQSYDRRAICPKHGPGAVATGEKGNDKWRFKRHYALLHQRFPYYEFFMVSGSDCLLDTIGEYKSRERLVSGTAKVVLVPKDSRGPRLISCEPLEYQFIQQGIKNVLYPLIESHPLTKGFVNFTDQSINQELARSGSVNRENATLDMKDASDRVSLALVKALFPKELYLDLYASRTAATQLPDGSILPLTKFAPMGSALCFPVEAIVFWSLCVSLLSEKMSESRARRSVYVFGDDIIVPSAFADYVMDGLSKYGLTANRDKSFSKGYFRESCGMDAYRGVQITPTRLKSLGIDNPWNGDFLASFVAFANHMASKGYEEVSKFCFETVERITGPIPYGTSSASYLSRTVHSAFYALIKNLESGFKCRWNSQLHRVEIRGLRVSPVAITQPLDGWQRYLSSLLVKRETDPDQVMLPRRIQICRRWVEVS